MGAPERQCRGGLARPRLAALPLQRCRRRRAVPRGTARAERQRLPVAGHHDHL